MSKLPSINGVKVIKAFEKMGFYLNKVEGSHHIMCKDEGQLSVSIPVHKGKDIKKGTLNGILKGANITREQFLENI